MINADLPPDEFVRRQAIVLRPDELEDYDPLLKFIGDKRIVLIGEASHGTHEFYRERAQITKRLITEKGFTVVAVEADFPDANRVNRFIQGSIDDENAAEALAGFKRFPTWMWRNSDVLDFVGWLRTHNDLQTSKDQKAGFFGLDLYSLNTSMDAVLQYLQNIDPEAAERARKRYSCFDHFGEDTQRYGYAANLGIAKSCENDVVDQLTEIHARSLELLSQGGQSAQDDLFIAEQNARLVKNAERYYRMMFRNDVSSWNLRDQHMMETLIALDAHRSTLNQKAKIVVWEHNSHLGDARATEMGKRGEWNVGQLTRERYPDDAVLVGFTTYSGTVSAASDWGSFVERKKIVPGLPGSYEEVFHHVGLDRFLLLMSKDSALSKALEAPLLERAIGVIYRPET